MKTKRQQAKAAADKVARERKKRNKKAAEVKKRAKERQALKEARILLKKQKAVPKKAGWVKRLLSRQVTALPEGKLTKEQIHEEYVKIAEKRSTLSRRDRARIEHAHEQSIRKITGMDRKKIGEPVEAPAE